MKNIGLLVVFIFIMFVPKTLTAQIQSTVIDSTEYTYFAFPIVYDEVDEFEGTNIIHTTRVDSWVKHPESGILASIWLTQLDDLLILNTLVGFNACVNEETNLKIRLKSNEIVELQSLNEIECKRLKIIRYQLDEESVSKIISSKVETVRFSTTEGKIDFKPQFAEDRYISSLEYHKQELNDPIIDKQSKSYHNEALEELEVDYRKGYKGNIYSLVHITSAKFETSMCGTSGEYYGYEMGDSYGMLDDTFRKYDVNSCEELIAFYNEEYDILASLLLTLLSK